MPKLPGDGGPYAIVNWEPVLHLVSRYENRQVIMYYNEHACVPAMCGATVTGYIDDASKYVITCLECLVYTWVL